MKNFNQNTKISKLSEELKNEIISVYGNNLEDIILYGSYARGDNGLDSDMDIMILVNEQESELASYRSKLMEKMNELSLKFDIVISSIDKSKADFLKYTEYVPFYRNVMQEGIGLYAK